MQFSVGQLLKEPIGSTRTYTLEETVDPLEDGHEEPVRGQVRFMRMDKGIWVLGTLDTGAPGVCSRCLVSFRQSITVNLDELYYPRSDPQTDAPLPDSLLEEGFLIEEHSILDLEESVHQGIISSLPMKPLCRADCRGICPQCGASDNEEPCECRAVRSAPPVGSLAAFLPQELNVS